MAKPSASTATRSARVVDEGPIPRILQEGAIGGQRLTAMGGQLNSTMGGQDLGSHALERGDGGHDLQLEAIQAGLGAFCFNLEDDLVTISYYLVLVHQEVRGKQFRHVTILIGVEDRTLQIQPIGLPVDSENPAGVRIAEGSSLCDASHCLLIPVCTISCEKSDLVLVRVVERRTSRSKSEDSWDRSLDDLGHQAAWSSMTTLEGNEIVRSAPPPFRGISPLSM